MSVNKIPVAALDFEGIRANFQQFLKGDPNYADWNFEGSGISRLNDIMGYHAHYIGVYVKMLLDEAFVDSAHTRTAQLSHAKRTGYIPKGKRSARAEVQLRCTVPLISDPLSKVIHVPAGMTFSAVNSSADNRTFIITDDVLMYDRTVDGSNAIYTSEPFLIYEGTPESWRFVVDGDTVNQRFVIRDRDIDISTLRVNVYPFLGSDDAVEFKLADDIFDLDSKSNVFFVTTDENGYYQIFFGNDVFGVKPQNGNIISTRYVSTNGGTGNGAKVFTFNGDGFGLDEDFETITVSMSSGGMEEEDTETLRFTIPHHFRRQNRLLTESDYRAILLSEFRNIDSINVWGGERNGIREYGKVFVSIKPKHSDALTSSARTEIRDTVLSRYGMVGGDIEFVDPQYIDVDVKIIGKVDLRFSNDNLKVIEGRVLNRVRGYNDDVMNKFGVILSDIDLLNHARSGDSSITSIFTTKILRKKQEVIHRSSGTNRVEFVNAIEPRSIKSGDIVYGGSMCVLKDDGQGNIFLYVKKTGVSILGNKTSGRVDYETGVVEFQLPTFAQVADYEGQTRGLIEVSAVPRDPDIYTSLSNILRISRVTIGLTA